MAEAEYAILIKPQWDQGEISGLFVLVTVSSPMRKMQELICQFEVNRQGVPTHSYGEANLHAYDNEGPLTLNLEPGNRSMLTKNYTVDRDTVGDVKLQLEVCHRVVDSTTPTGPRVDLRRDQGGLIGSGGWFLPIIPYYSRFLFSVEWDLSLLPHGTRGLWSYGEGPARTTEEGPLPLLLNSIFMMGNINTCKSFTSPTRLQCRQFTGLETFQHIFTQ
ncbi:hypothetical protein NQ176_g6634 [Zarea fungicola]|uniref:Uncharacterized protein n=1 Tax=Zarea fungicola TaxID=93591 RepID=A0ACC1N2V2_9HYPO|nr:hypothetical protein NQ176_g6634 [Lecanicillium fungicola]